MRTYRIVYIDDDTFAPRALTAAFASRAAAEVAMAQHGHRIVHLAEMRIDERATDPIGIEIACGPDRPAVGTRAPTRRTASLALARHGIAGLAAALGIVAAGAAYLMR